MPIELSRLDQARQRSCVLAAETQPRPLSVRFHAEVEAVPVLLAIGSVVRFQAGERGVC